MSVVTVNSTQDSEMALVPVPPTPAERLQAATEIADVLTNVIEQKKLYVAIQGRRHVLAEGWQVLASLMQVGLETEWTRPLYLEDSKAVWGYEARVLARSKDGQVLGSAESMCTRAERQWSDRDDFALRSMAQTRAVSRTLRQCIGFIVKLSGFDATPADEMPQEEKPKRPAATSIANKPIGGPARIALWEVAKTAAFRTGHKADEIINQCCAALDVDKSKTGWTIREKNLIALTVSVKTWEPGENPAGDEFVEGK